MAEIRNVIVGTAGHIDHGKSSVVRALTGIDPDRLTEERERGMTIDLGFAPYTHASGAEVGLIDVPGHERFIKNMVAGSTSVDVALLIVAADDGVMPQTVEHLEILRLLGVRRGLVALTKIDLVDEDLVALAREDVAELVTGSFLEGAPVVPVSAPTGEGLDELREALDRAIAEVVPAATEGPFRLPVQRVFSAKGHGLVVTGVPVSGGVAPGDELEVVASGQPVRVRGIQAYGRSREAGGAGHSTALNLAGATTSEVQRGDVVATAGVFAATRFVTLAYEHVAQGRPLRHWHPVRLHAGTAEVMGRVALLDCEHLEAGGQGSLQVRLADPVTVAPGDAVLLRDAAAMVVLGGGRVLSVDPGRHKRFKERVLEDARTRAAALGDPAALVVACLASAGARGASVDDLVRACGLDGATVKALIDELSAEGDVVTLGPLALTGEALDEVADQVRRAVREAHRRHPMMDWADVAEVRGRVDLVEGLVSAVLERDRRFETASGGRVRLRGHRASLSDAQSRARERVLEAVRAGGATPPTVDEELTGLNAKETKALLAMMQAAGEIVRLGGAAFEGATFARMREQLVAHGTARDGEIDIPSLRDELGTTRKFLIPLLEHFDSEGLTVRHGDRRVLRQRSADA